MQRDMDLVRDILLKLETQSWPPGSVVMFAAGDLSIPNKTSDEVTHHLLMLMDAGFIDAEHMPGGGFRYRGVKWDGHEFLESIRDPDVWQKTKTGALAAGSWTLGILKDLAFAYAKAKIQKVTGVTF